MVADKVKKKVPESNQKSEFHSRNPTEERQTVGNIKIEEKIAVKGLEELKAKSKKENQVLYAVDKNLSCLVIVINGTMGDQHKII